MFIPKFQLDFILRIDKRNSPAGQVLMKFMKQESFPLDSQKKRKEESKDHDRS